MGLGIIDKVEVEFAAGFVALTGETGAGKSLLVESLKLLAGQRASSDLVRTGDDRLQVIGWFDGESDPGVATILADLGVEDATELVIRREVTAAGRSRCWVNDSAVTTTLLQRLAPCLLAIHGQHEQYGLMDPTAQRDLVDAFAGHSELMANVARAWGVWDEAQQEAARLRAAAAARRDRLDAIAFQLAEIDGVAPKAGEDDELRVRRRVLRHAVRLGELHDQVLTRLADGDGDVLQALARCERDLSEMVEIGLPVAELGSRIEEARVLIEDVIRELQAADHGLEDDPAELDQMESRLHRLEQLMLKYGTPLTEVLAHRDRLIAERDELEEVAERVGTAEMEARQRLTEFDRLAAELDASRRQAGEVLLAQTVGVLESLNMVGTRLELAWAVKPEASSALQRDDRPVAFDASGVEMCELLIAANPGETPKPMSRIASGGELSRLHLALRTVLRRKAPSTRLTLLFDEVDSGLGGATAASLGGLLAGLGESDQVLVVTHLPQVAARAGAHLRIEKVALSGRAVTRVSALEGAAREIELARMLSGDDHPESARAHARALLEA
jgi:DNA repair protein RecN (Recombination protein N)